MPNTQITRCLSPVRAEVEHTKHHVYLAETLKISKEEARKLDHEARTQIAKELGHGRISVTNQYLG